MAINHPSHIDKTKIAPAISNLLPQGDAFDTSPESNLYRLSLIIGDGAGEFIDFLEKAVMEMNPQQADETLTVWEAAVFNNDPCYTLIPRNIVQRRAAIIARLRGSVNNPTITGIQTAVRDFSQDSTILVRESTPFRVGISRVGDRLDGSPSVSVDNLTPGILGATSDEVEFLVNCLLESFIPLSVRRYVNVSDMLTAIDRLYQFANITLHQRLSAFLEA